MSSQNKILKAFGWQSINVFSQSILQLLFMSILARLISPESFGVMAIVLMITGFIDIFAQIGIGPAIIQRKEITQNQLSSSFYLSTLLGICFFLILWFCAPLVASYYDYAPFVDLLRVIGISFLISAISIVPKSLLYKKLHFKELFISGFFGMIIGNIVVGITLAYYDFQIWSYVAALLVQNGVMTFFYWWFNPIKLRKNPTLKYATPLVRYGGGSTLFNLFNYLSSKADVFIVGTYSDLNKVSEINQSRWGATGIYDQSLRVIGYPITIIGKLSDSVMFSGLSMIQDQIQKLKFAFRTAFSVLSIISIPTSVFLVIYAKEVVLLILGDQYYDAIPIVQVLFVGLFLRTIIKLCDALLRALDRVYSGALIKFLYFALICALVFIMATDNAVSEYFSLGLKGVAWALLFCILFQFIIMIRLCISMLKLTALDLVKLTTGPLVLGFITLIFSLLSYLSLEHLFPQDSFFIVVVKLIIGVISLGLSYLAMFWFFPQLFGRGEHNMLNVLLKKLPSIGFLSTVQKRVKEKTEN